MAAEWIPCGSGFIEADVIRWNEAASSPLRRDRFFRHREPSQAAAMTAAPDRAVVPARSRARIVSAIRSASRATP